MIRPPGFGGAAFDTADGDGRHDLEARHRICRELGIPDAWACVHQVHGNRARPVTGPGRQGDGDALFTTVPRLPLAIGHRRLLSRGPGRAGERWGWRMSAGGGRGGRGAARALREATRRRSGPGRGDRAGLVPLRRAGPEARGTAGRLRRAHAVPPYPGVAVPPPPTCRVSRVWGSGICISLRHRLPLRPARRWPGAPGGGGRAPGRGSMRYGAGVRCRCAGGPG